MFTTTTSDPNSSHPELVEELADQRHLEMVIKTVDWPDDVMELGGLGNTGRSSVQQDEDAFEDEWFGLLSWPASRQHFTEVPQDDDEVDTQSLQLHFAVYRETVTYVNLLTYLLAYVGVYGEGQWHHEQEIRSVEHGICPVTLFITLQFQKDTDILSH